MHIYFVALGLLSRGALIDRGVDQRWLLITAMLTFQSLRDFKARTVVRSISRRPIIILASRRGGSSVIGDVIARNRGVWYANEPFAVYPSHPGFSIKERYLPEREHSQYFDLNDSELEQFEQYVAGLLRAEFSELGTCRHVTFPYSANRVCLKILNTPLMLSWFVRESLGDVIYLTRHPAPQALSVLRLGWDFAVQAYFRRTEALAQFFTASQIAYGKDILKRGNQWEIAILDWVVNTQGGRTSPDDSFITARYEHLVMNPTPFVLNVLHRKLGLENVNEMLAQFERPSGSSMLCTDRTVQAIRNDDRQVLLSSWMDKTDKSDRGAAQKILNKFEVHEYDMYHSYPLEVSEHGSGAFVDRFVQYDAESVVPIGRGNSAEKRDSTIDYSG